MGTVTRWVLARGGEGDTQSTEVSSEYGLCDGLTVDAWGPICPNPQNGQSEP